MNQITESPITAILPAIHILRENPGNSPNKRMTRFGKLFLGITHSPIFIDLRRCRQGQRCVIKPLLLPKFLTKQNDSPTILLTILNIHCTCFEVMWFDPLMKVIHCQLCMFRKYKFRGPRGPLEFFVMAFSLLKLCLLISISSLRS